MGGRGGRATMCKKNIYSRKGKLNEKKNRARQLFLKKYSCYGLKKKIHARNLIAKKNSCCSKIPFPPLSSGIEGQQNGGFSGLFYVFLLRSSQVRISVGSVVFKSENQKRVKKSSKKRPAIVNVNVWIIIICFCINGYCMVYMQP